MSTILDAVEDYLYAIGGLAITTQREYKSKLTIFVVGTFSRTSNT